jgi:ribose 5-phosphate isomerase A
VSPDGGLIADYTGPIGDPGLLASRFAGIPGLVEHGMFAPELVTEIFVARGRDAERIEGRRR